MIEGSGELTKCKKSSKKKMGKEGRGRGKGQG